MLSCEWHVVLFLHVFFWCPIPQMHSESSRKRSCCDTNVGFFTRPAILVWTYKFINHIGALQLVFTWGKIVFHQNASCFLVTVEYDKFKRAILVRTFYILVDDVLYHAFVDLVRWIHEIAIIQGGMLTLLCSSTWAYFELFNMIFELLSNLSVHCTVRIAIIH